MSLDEPHTLLFYHDFSLLGLGIHLLCDSGTSFLGLDVGGSAKSLLEAQGVPRKNDESVIYIEFYALQLS